MYFLPFLSPLEVYLVSTRVLLLLKNEKPETLDLVDSTVQIDAKSEVSPHDNDDGFFDEDEKIEEILDLNVLFLESVDIAELVLCKSETDLLCFG